MSYVGRISQEAFSSDKQRTAWLEIQRILLLGSKLDQVLAHIRSWGYHILDRDPTDAERQQYDRLIKVTQKTGYNAQRTPMDLPIAQLVVKAIQSTEAEPIVLSPSSGEFTAVRV